MSFAERHNKGQNLFTFRLKSTKENGEQANFKKLAELDPDVTYIIRGFFISKAGKYGKHPVAIVTIDKKPDSETGFFVDFPKSATSEIEEILASKEDVDSINNCEVGFTTHTYDNKYGNGFTGFTFVDI